MRPIVFMIAIIALGASPLSAMDKKEKLDAITGYQHAEWGNSVAEVESKMGPLTEREGLYFQQGSLKGQPAYVQYRFLKDKLIEIGVVLNAPDFPKDKYPDLYERIRMEMIRLFGYPEKEDKKLLDIHVMPFDQQLANGYVHWTCLWHGKLTSIVLGMTVVKDSLVFYITYLPEQISPEGQPNPEAQR